MLIPLGRSLGTHGGVVWLREAWRVYRQARLATIVLAGAALVLLALGLANGLGAALALVGLPFLLTAGARIVQLERRGEAPHWHAIHATLRRESRGLLRLGLLGLAVGLALSLLVRLSEPLSHAETLGHLIAQALALLVLASTMLFSPFLMLEHKLTPARALLASAAGCWRNLLGAAELTVGFVVACVAMCTPVILIWVVGFSKVPMSFGATIWMPATAGLLLLPALVLSPYFAYRDIFVEEPPPAELTPLRL
ncbi:hypothetical protein [Niveibacterium sp. SC-1]|uniref:hypothetical protein n=1 Tax=Niveibacterium sp. SC-1 TaxID=3135646 RepID=UPI0031203796